MSQEAVLWSKIPLCITAGRQHLASCGFIFFKRELQNNLWKSHNLMGRRDNSKPRRTWIPICVESLTRLTISVMGVVVEAWDITLALTKSLHFPTT